MTVLIGMVGKGMSETGRVSQAASMPTSANMICWRCFDQTHADEILFDPQFSRFNRGKSILETHTKQRTYTTQHNTNLAI